MLARSQLFAPTAALVAWLLLGGAAAQAQAAANAAETTSDVSQAQATPVEPEPPTEEQVAAQTPAPPTAETSADQASRQIRKAALQAALVKVEREQAHKSLLLPWSALSISIATVATGLVLGLSKGLGCERSCTASAWPGWLVLVGTTTGTVSLLWLELEARSTAELQSRRLGLQRELERIRWQETPARAPHAALSWGGRF